MRRWNRPVQHWFRWWLVVYSAPSHYLNQCSLIFNWILRNKKWNSNHSTKLLVQVNSLESDFCEMAVILSRPQCVNSSCTGTLQWRHNGLRGKRFHLMTSSWPECSTIAGSLIWRLMRWYLASSGQRRGIEHTGYGLPCLDQENI